MGDNKTYANCGDPIELEQEAIQIVTLIVKQTQIVMMDK